MQSISTIGLDIAKSVFQVHGVDAAGQVVLRRQLRRRAGIFPEAAAMSGGDRGVRLIAPLVPRAAGARAYGALDAAGLCEALRQAAEERHDRRGGDLRGGHEAKHAVCADQVARTTELSDASSSAPSVHPPADCRHQFSPRLSGRVRNRRPRRAQGCRATA
jgi:transposase